MRVVLFGATAMVGQGVLRECLRDSAVSQVVCIGRTPLGARHPKVEQLVTEDLFELGVPLDGIPSKTPGYRVFYSVFGVLLPPLQRLFPRSMSTTRTIGLAMLEVARHGAKSPILRPADIHAAASLAAAAPSIDPTGEAR